MLRITLDINGRDIGCIGVWNTQEKRVSEGDAHVVEVRYQVHDLRGHKAHGGEITEYPKIADVWHDANDGAAALTARVMQVVDEDRLDDRSRA